ncbi:hypothetical protein PHMEG_00029908 [Phytophthora megakarya]|uniref:Uncharacterized protein n=1 Tax=Phytophthora megakarya TaxID=4795 RepID=A0A225V1I5_9STRA|nr:hypothetical protein PHMEG_00029908 [Phytophthora megakarya]
MIRCCLSLGLDGTWSEKQLYPHLQEIIKKHQVHFDCEPVHTSKGHVANNQNEVTEDAWKAYFLEDRKPDVTAYKKLRLAVKSLTMRGAA